MQRAGKVDRLRRLGGDRSVEYVCTRDRAVSNGSRAGHVMMCDGEKKAGVDVTHGSEVVLGWFRK